MEREAVLVAIDVGTSKVCALIGEVARDGSLTIVGKGVVPAGGAVFEPALLVKANRPEGERATRIPGPARQRGM